MILEDLEKYYGKFPEHESKYVEENVMKLSAEEQQRFYTKLTESRSKRMGVPDLAALSKVLKEISGSKAKVYIWSVCNDCGAEYDYKFMTCPKCHLEGKHSSGYKVKKSDFPPTFKVIRWNQTTLQDDGKAQYCVSCQHTEKNYCRWFGEPNHTCSREEYEYCECKKCCAFHKRANQRAQK